MRSGIADTGGGEVEGGEEGASGAGGVVRSWRHDRRHCMQEKGAVQRL